MLTNPLIDGQDNDSGRHKFIIQSRIINLIDELNGRKITQCITRAEYVIKLKGDIKNNKKILNVKNEIVTKSKHDF